MGHLPNIGRRGRADTGPPLRKRARSNAGRRTRMVEAGGVEPPSEKPCCQKTTCVAHSFRGRPLRALRAFAARGQYGQETRAASPMISPAQCGPKCAGQPTM